MVVALSVACAIFYGAADFCGGLAARRMPAVAVLVWSQAVGFVILLAVLPFIPGVPHLADFGYGAACGIAGAAAVGLLYRALAVGTMGVISPITAVLAAAVPVTFAFFRGDRPALIALVGIGLALVAVVLVSAVAPRRPTAPTRRWPARPNRIASRPEFLRLLAQVSPSASSLSPSRKRTPTPDSIL